MEQLTLPSSSFPFLLFSISHIASILSGNGNEVFIYSVSPMEQLTLPSSFFSFLFFSISHIASILSGNGNEVLIYLVSPMEQLTLPSFRYFWDPTRSSFCCGFGKVFNWFCVLFLLRFSAIISFSRWVHSELFLRRVFYGTGSPSWLRYNRRHKLLATSTMGRGS
jgi:hypothetical protein